MIGNVVISEVGCSYVCCTKQDRKTCALYRISSWYHGMYNIMRSRNNWIRYITKFNYIPHFHFVITWQVSY